MSQPLCRARRHDRPWSVRALGSIVPVCLALGYLTPRLINAHSRDAPRSDQQAPRPLRLRARLPRERYFPKAALTPVAAQPDQQAERLLHGPILARLPGGLLRLCHERIINPLGSLSSAFLKRVRAEAAARIRARNYRFVPRRR
jgi:hypothetical protein